MSAKATSRPDRKSTRLNSSHGSISYAVFCLKKKIKSSDDRFGAAEAVGLAGDLKRFVRDALVGELGGQAVVFHCRDFFFFFFNDTATTEIYTLSLHDALPICLKQHRTARDVESSGNHWPLETDRKSTRLNSSHGSISYAVFCLKKKKKTN